MPDQPKSLPSFASGLSARLLLLTIGFVMLAEVLIYTPSIGRFRLVFLEERLSAGHLAVLALEATPDQMVGPELTTELLAHAEAYSVGLTKPGGGKLMLMDMPPESVDASYDLRAAGFAMLVRDAFATLQAKPGRTLRVVGASPRDSNAVVDLVLDESPLREAMFAFSRRILGLSLLISLITAALVYLSLHWLLVRPMRRITSSMSAFRQDPEDGHRVMRPSGRGDEIGYAERELAEMQEGMRAALQQKTRLAALGIAVTKINHDLRNILSTALLVSDRLDRSDDPEVRRISPILVQAIERAVNLCAQTLNFTREGPPTLELSRFDLRDLANDVGATLPEAVNGEDIWRNLMEEGIEIEADRDQLFRVLSNLAQNAVQSGASTVEIKGERIDGRCRVTVSDNGPGLPPRAAERLFQPFTGSARPGGTGLGLAIARDLVRAHGGRIRLDHSTAEGAAFSFEIPIEQSED